MAAIAAAALFAVAALRTGAPAEAAFPGENGKIVFDTNRDGGWEIYAMNPDGSAPTRLTNNPAFKNNPAWSPDGRKIAFRSDQDGNPEIYVINADGSGQARLTSNAAVDDDPAWSPDGRRIAFTSYRDGDAEIYVMNADGSGQQRLTTGGGVNPAWSPAGGRIAFASSRDGNPEIYVIGAGGGGETRLTNHPADDREPDWSPDGGKIAFESTRDGNAEIYVMNADGGGVQRLTVNAGFDGRPAFSPDGEKIAFARGPAGSRQIYSMNADGSGQSSLTGSATNEDHPDWQPLVPHVTEISPAIAPTRGGAAVLTAEVGGNVERLEWDVRGDGRPEIVSSHPGQTSIRFRPPPGRDYTVNVRAVGPGGAGPTLSQTLTAPRAPATGLARQVQSELAKRPPVYAVGTVDALTKPPAAQPPGSTVPTTVVSGSLRYEGPLAPATRLTQVPAPVRGIADRISNQLSVPSRLAPLNTATSLIDSYVAKAPVTINNDLALAPGPKGAIVAAPQLKAVAVSSAKAEIAGLPLPIPGRTTINLNPSKSVTGNLASINGSAYARLIGDRGGIDTALKALGASLAGTVDIGLLRDGARFDITLKLPSFLRIAGGTARARVRLGTSGGQVVVDEMTIGPLNDLKIGELGVRRFQIDYRRAANEWRGGAEACLLGCFAADVTIRNGRLDFAKGFVGFGTPGIPLFKGVFLEGVGFGIGLGPTRLAGEARIAAVQIVEINGRMVFAFPPPAFNMRPQEIGGFPGHLYRSYSGTTIGVNGDASLRLPSPVPNVPLASAYALYSHPGYFATGGRLRYTFGLFGFNAVSLDAGVSGELDVGSGRFNFHGSGDGCVVAVVCGGAVANISSRGIAICVTHRAFIVQTSQGFRYFWGGGFKPWLLDGCKWSETRVVVRAARSAGAEGAIAAGTAHVVRVRSGRRSRMVELEGAGGAPMIRVTGPGGQVLESPSGDGLEATEGGAIRILRAQDSYLTAVGLQDPRPGAYRIEPLDGSPAVSRIGEATDPRPARIKANARGKGKRRVLTYRIRRRPAQRVTFVDIAPGGAEKQIGVVRGGGRGKLRFAPAPGRGKRRIEARFELAGVAAERRVVARFKPPSPRLGKAKRLRVRRLGKRLRVSWGKVRAARRYEVAVAPSNRPQRSRTTRKRRTVIKGVPKSATGYVIVRAIDRRAGATIRAGSTARARFPRTARQRTSIGPLPRCRGKGKIVCRKR